MKLRLPKHLCVAAMAAATSALGADLSQADIETPVAGGDSYLNVGSGTFKPSYGYSTYTEHQWNGDLTVGDTEGSQGMVDKVGAFDENWNAITPNGTNVITNSLKVTGNVTVQGNGEILLGGYSPRDAQVKYAAFMGIAANSMTVNGGKVDITKLVTENLKVTNGSVNLSNTENCLNGGSETTGEWKSYSQISQSLILAGGNLHFGNAQNTKPQQSIFGSNVKEAPDFSLTQTGGNMTVWGKAAMAHNSTVAQSEGAGNMIFRDTLTVKIGANKTTNFVQDADNAKMLIGQLYIEGGSSPQTVKFTQDGNGIIQLAYGVAANESGARRVELVQNAGGSIILGGGHDTTISGELPEDYALNNTFEYSHVKYDITQNGANGSIQLKQGATICASSVIQNSAKTELSIEKGAELRADNSIKIKGTLSLQNGATLKATELVVNEGATLEAVRTDDEVAVVFGISAQDAELLSPAATLATDLVFEDGAMLNLDGGNIDMGGNDLVLKGKLSITLSGDMLGEDEFVLFSNVGDVSAEEIEVVVNGVTTTGNISGEDVIVDIAGVPNVPEPTTATLSLLALAGLAARRRRR